MSIGHPDNDVAEEPATLQARLRSALGDAPSDTEAPAPSVDDPVALFHHLEATGRFRLDSGFGRIYHPAAVSLREDRPSDSLHVIVDENHIAAHVDRVSPLGTGRYRAGRYSVRRAAAHNLAGAAHDLLLLIQGRKGDHRSRLDCEWVWGLGDCEPKVGDLLPPEASSWSVQLEARVAGALDGQRLREAIGAAAGRRPVRRELLDVVDCPDDAALDQARAELQATPVGVTDWPPLRARLAHHPDGDVFMLNLNHAATDGPGALRVLRTVAAAYAGGPQPGPLPDFVAVNDLPVRPASSPVSRTQAWSRGVVERIRDRLARPARLAVEEPDDEQGYGFHLVRLSTDDTSRVLDRARRTGTGSTTAVLVAALHLAIGEWNLEHGTPGRRVGVLVPVDLRTPDWPDELVANLSVTARVSTSRRHRSGPSAALREILGQSRRNRRVRTGVALLDGLHRTGLLPLWAKQSLVVLQPLTRNVLVDTAMLANLGEIEEPPTFGAGAGTTVDVWFSAPARTPESLCLGAVIVAGRLHLTFRYPHRLFGAGAVRRFADGYVHQVRLVADRRW